VNKEEIDTRIALLQEVHAALIKRGETRLGVQFYADEVMPAIIARANGTIDEAVLAKNRASVVPPKRGEEWPELEFDVYNNEIYGDGKWPGTVAVVYAVPYRTGDDPVARVELPDYISHEDEWLSSIQLPRRVRRALIEIGVPL